MSVLRIIGGMAALAVPLFFSGCGAPGEYVSNPPPGMVRVPATLPQGGFLDCGPEVLSAVLALYGKPADVQEISDGICEKTKGGTMPLALAAWAGRYGLRTLAAPGCPDATLAAALEAGIPAVTMVQLAPLTFHFYLVIGAPPGEIVCADYDHAVRLFKKSEFDKIWNRTHRYTLFIAPDVSAIPYDEKDYLSRLEEPPFPIDWVDARTHYLIGLDYEQRELFKLAKIEYRRAVDLDSRRVDAALALGNLYFFKEDNVGEAVNAYRRGAHAGGSCANNLAFVLSEKLGKPGEAWGFAKAAEAQCVRRSEPWFSALDTQGTVAMRLGRPRDAMDSWKRAADACGEAEREKRGPFLVQATRAAIAAGERAAAAELMARAEQDGVDAVALAELRELLKKP
ncbi:MAG: cysteine peptidase family C39 domain-containing protein [Planctomycetota bacterium]